MKFKVTAIATAPVKGYIVVDSECSQEEVLKQLSKKEVNFEFYPATAEKTINVQDSKIIIDFDSIEREFDN